jgi:hypothetical protein
LLASVPFLSWTGVPAGLKRSLSPPPQTVDCGNALFQGWVSIFGILAAITSDHCAQFISSLWDALWYNLLNIQHAQTTAYQPQSNGLEKHFHRARWPEKITSCFFILMTDIFGAFSRVCDLCLHVVPFFKFSAKPDKYYTRNCVEILMTYVLLGTKTGCC